MKNRILRYDTTMTDNFKVLYTLEVDNPDAVELYMPSLLHNFKYRDNKDFYDCSLKTIKEIFHKCNEFVTKGIYCNYCNTHINNIRELIEHSNEHHRINQNDAIVLYVANKPLFFLLSQIL